MMSSAALPKVAFKNPPHAGPERAARCSVPLPIRPASGTSETAAVMNTHGEPGAVASAIHDAGAGQEVEERVEAPIERAPQLRDGAVEGVERQAGRRSIGKLQRRLVDAF